MRENHRNDNLGGFLDLRLHSIYDFLIFQEKCNYWNGHFQEDRKDQNNINGEFGKYGNSLQSSFRDFPEKMTI